MPTVELTGDSAASGGSTVTDVPLNASAPLIVRGPLITYLRDLVDDAITESNSDGFWSDAELWEALEVERRSVQPWTEGDAGNSFWFGENTGGSMDALSTWWNVARYDLQRLNPASKLDAGPGFTRYQVRPPYRFWAETPAPVIYVNGGEATAAGFTYTLDSFAGAVTFTAFPNGASALSVGDTVTAAFDRYLVYEAAYTLIMVAMGQWAAVMETSKNGVQMSRARLSDSMDRVERLRRKGRPLPRPRYAPVA
jgi:hypothetical protein